MIYLQLDDNVTLTLNFGWNRCSLFMVDLKPYVNVIFWLEA